MEVFALSGAAMSKKVNSRYALFPLFDSRRLQLQEWSHGCGCPGPGSGKGIPGGLPVGAEHHHLTSGPVGCRLIELLGDLRIRKGERLSRGLDQGRNIPNIGSVYLDAGSRGRSPYPRREPVVCSNASVLEPSGPELRPQEFESRSYGV